MRIPSLSSLGRAAACPGSTVLPVVEHDGQDNGAAIGNALHDYIATSIKHGRMVADEARWGIADKWRLIEDDAGLFFWRAKSFDPVVPKGALAEVPLCLMADGSVVLVSGGHGRYELPPGAIIAGTIDALWSDPEPLAAGRCPAGSAVWAPDWKTGTPDQRPDLRLDYQARGAALLAARWTGAEVVVPAICYVQPGAGVWHVREDEDGAALPFGATDLRAIEDDVRGVVARVREEHARARDGKDPTLTTGAHCIYCPSRALCPAHVAEVRALVSDEAPSMLAAPLSQEQAVRLATLRTRLHGAAKAVDDALKTHVDTFGPIALPDGREYGATLEPVDDIDALAAYAELKGEVGEERAAKALRISKDAMKATIRAAHDERGVKRQGAATMRRVTDALRARGSITTRHRVEYSIHQRPRELAEALRESVAANETGGENKAS
jgi:hypothetical protein